MASQTPSAPPRTEVPTSESELPTAAVPTAAPVPASASREPTAPAGELQAGQGRGSKTVISREPSPQRADGIDSIIAQANLSLQEEEATVGTMRNAPSSSAVTVPATPNDNSADDLKNILTLVQRIEKRMDTEFVTHSQLKDIPRINRATKRRVSDLSAEDFLEKNGTIPNVEYFIEEPDFAQLLLKKLMQMTVFLWTENMPNTKLGIDEKPANTLRAYYTNRNIKISDISGLAIMLFSSRNNSQHDTKKSFDSELGKSFISMTSQIITDLFQKTRKTKYRSWDRVNKKFVFPEENPMAPEPHTYMTKALVVPREKTEEEFHRVVVENLSKTPGSKYGYEGLLGRSSKKRRVSNRSLSNSLSAIQHQVSDTVADRDVPDLKARCLVTKFIQQQIRGVMNTARNQSRKHLYTSFFFAVRRIASSTGNSGYRFEWNNSTGNGRMNSIPTDLQNPQMWVIPEAFTSDTKEADEYNTNALTALMAQFPSMKCKLHYRQTARTPSHSEDPELLDEFLELIQNNGGNIPFIERTKEINFYTMALTFLQTLYHTPCTDPALPIMRTSRYSLRAIHIIALGIRAATLSTTGGTCSEAENNAWLSVTASQQLDTNNYSDAFIMMGAVIGGVAAEATSETQNLIEQRVTTMRYKHYKTEKAELAARAAEVAAEAAAAAVANAKDNEGGGHGDDDNSPILERRISTSATGTIPGVPTTRNLPPSNMIIDDDEDDDAYGG